MDTSRHKWLPDIDQYFGLILIIDDRSRKFLEGKLVEGDTTWENMLVLRRVVEKYGVFRALYVDNDSEFKYNKRNFSLYFDYHIKEFRANNIRILEEANEWLRKQIEWWKDNHRHWVTKETPNQRFNKESYFQPVPLEVNLDDVFCLRERRIVNRDNTFKYDGKVYQITKGTVSRMSWYKVEIELHIILKKIRVFHGNEFIQEFSFKWEEKACKYKWEV